MEYSDDLFFAYAGKYAPGMLHTGGMCPGSMCVAVYWQMCAVPGIGALCLAQPPAVCMKAFPSHVAECARHAKVAPILFMAHALDVGKLFCFYTWHTGLAPGRPSVRAWRAEAQVRPFAGEENRQVRGAGVGIILRFAGIAPCLRKIVRFTWGRIRFCTWHTRPHARLSPPGERPHALRKLPCPSPSTHALPPAACCCRLLR